MGAQSVGFGHTFPQCPAGDYPHFMRSPLTAVQTELPETYRKARFVEVRGIERQSQYLTGGNINGAKKKLIEIGAEGVEKLQELRVAEITTDRIQSYHLGIALRLFTSSYQLLMGAREENGALNPINSRLIGRGPDFKNPDVVQNATNFFSSRLNGEIALLITLTKNQPIGQIDLKSQTVLDLFEILGVKPPVMNDRRYRHANFQTFRVFGDGAAFVSSFWLPFELVIPNECEKYR